MTTISLSQMLKLIWRNYSYLFEISDQDTCARITETALSACDDKSSLLYAELLNIVGRRDHELNRLSDCRKNWEETLRIRKLHLPKDHILSECYGASRCSHSFSNDKSRYHPP